MVVDGVWWAADAAELCWAGGDCGGGASATSVGGLALPFLALALAVAASGGGVDVRLAVGGRGVARAAGSGGASLGVALGLHFVDEGLQLGDDVVRLLDVLLELLLLLLAAVARAARPGRAHLAALWCMCERVASSE